MYNPEHSKIKSFMKRLESLRTERSQYMPYWQELAEFHLAQRGRFLSTNERKHAIKRNTKQFNNKSRVASRTLAAGMMTGITSPARPWFKLATQDPSLAEFGPVKEWLHIVEQRMYRIFAASNFYNSMHSLYSEVGLFATANMGIYENFDTVIQCKTYTIGSYMLDLGGSDEIDTHYREFQRSVGQVVKEFGKENVSPRVLKMWDQGNTETMIPLVHLVEPNDDRDVMSPFAGGMKFRSVTFERDVCNTKDEKLLRESGFRSFPHVTPRWDVFSEDVYGSDCPGMTCLGDNKALQLAEKRGYEALDRIVDPPTQGSGTFAGKSGNTTPRPGEHIALAGNDKGIEPIFKQYGPDFNAVIAMQDRIEQRISTAFYEDLFLMMIGDNRSGVTATEVAERHEEKLLMLGPVLERLHSEGLDKVIERTFAIMQQSGLVPPPPRELQNTEINVEYVSILAQAQRMVGIASIERTVGFVAQMVQIWPEARHKVDALQAVDEYSHAMGNSPKLIRTDDKVAQIMEGEQAALQQANDMAMAQGAAQIAQTASQTNIGPDNALGQTLRNQGLM